MLDHVDDFEDDFDDFEAFDYVEEDSDGESDGLSRKSKRRR
jgi:hypothetical protein